MRLMSRGYSIRYVDKRQMLYNRRGYRVDEVLLTEAVVQKELLRVWAALVLSTASMYFVFANIALEMSVFLLVLCHR